MSIRSTGGDQPPPPPPRSAAGARRDGPGATAALGGGGGRSPVVPSNPMQKQFPKKFQKANSTTTFLLDGMAYTIVAVPPGKPTISENAETTKDRRQPSVPDPGVDAAGNGSCPVASGAGGGGTVVVPGPAGAPPLPSNAAATEAKAAGAVEASKRQRRSNENGERRRDTAEHTDEGAHGCCRRLRHVLTRIQNDDITKEELANTLGHAIQLLETGTPDEPRFGGGGGDDDEEVFSSVETEVVPTEVRDWLAMTFTRSNANSAKRKIGDIPKFRSVAHVIRAGILVDRMYRRQASTVGMQLQLKSIVQMKNLDKWSFDVFSVNDASDGHALKYIGYELLQRYDLINKFKINVQTLESFLTRMEQGYSKFSNPYHNLLHAADVAQTLHHVISKTNLTLWLSDLDVFAAIFAALIHDYEHTGTTNTFHINTGSSVALLYNDRSVLENHHLTATFRLLQEDDLNVVSNLKTEDYREFRSIVIDVVLATDMSGHFVQHKNMKNLLLTPDNIDKTKALALTVHCADISHPSKEWKLHERWTATLIEEFFQQGDREEKLGLPISPLCDRKNTLVAESQIGFIDFIVEPSMQLLGDVLDAIMEKIQEKNITPAETPTPKDSGGTSNKMERQWEACLVENRQMWKDRAANGWISPLQHGHQNESKRNKNTEINDGSTDRESQPSED